MHSTSLFPLSSIVYNHSSLTHHCINGQIFYAKLRGVMVKTNSFCCRFCLEQYHQAAESCHNGHDNSPWARADPTEHPTQRTQLGPDASPTPSHLGPQLMIFSDMVGSQATGKPQNGWLMTTNGSYWIWGYPYEFGSSIDQRMNELIRERTPTRNKLRVESEELAKVGYVVKLPHS